MKKKFNVYFLKVIIAIFIVYFLILTFLYFFQRNLLYHASENNYSGDDLILQVDKVRIETTDEIKLLGWFHKKDLTFKTIIFFHGNAGSLENRIHKINHFKDMDINLLIIAWRGFSGNQGKPSEKGLYEDGQSAIKWLNKKDIKNENIIIYGESLGTGVATHLAQNNNFAGIVLESPFTSMIDAAQNVYPYFPINLLLKDRYENDKKIKNIKSPILIMHGKDDKLVPFWMGKKIYELANEPKYSYFPTNDNHMMEYNKDLLKRLNLFFKSLN